MESPRVVADYGGPFADEHAVENPTTEQPADKYNRHSDDSAQMSRTSEKALFDFLTVASGAVAAADVHSKSHFGTSASEKPVVARTGTGTYTATFAASYPDGLGETETTTFWKGEGWVETDTVVAFVKVSVSGPVATIKTRDTSGTLVDLANGTQIAVRLY